MTYCHFRCGSIEVHLPCYSKTNAEIIAVVDDPWHET